MVITKELRREVKAEQKQIVKQNLGKCIGAMALLCIPVIAIVALSVFLLMGAGIEQVTNVASSEYTMMDAYRMSSLLSHILGIYFLMILLYVVVISPLQMGLMQFYIKLSRKENPSPFQVFHPFTSVREIWRSIRMVFCLGLRTFLYMIVPIIVIGITISSVALNGVYAGQDTSGTILLAEFLYYIVAFLVSAKIMCYYGGYTICMEDDKIGIWHATSISGAMFRGKYRSMLTFLLSFLLWMIAYVVLLVLPMLLFFFGLEGVVIGTILVIVISIVFGAFISAYQIASFFALFDRLDPKEELLFPSPLMNQKQDSQNFEDTMQTASSQENTEEAHREDAGETKPTDDSDDSKSDSSSTNE